jgi:hypothetical protein
MATRRLLRAAPLACAIAATALLPNSASALRYDNTDPAASGCSSDAYTLASTLVNRTVDGSLVGTVELRWSPSCQTGWSRFSPVGGVWGVILANVVADRPSDSTTTSSWSTRWSTDWPLYGPQLNGSANCVHARANIDFDGPLSGEWAFGDTGCGGGPAPNGSSAETTGGAASTWTDYRTAGGVQGPTIGTNATVYVSCKVTGFRVADGNTWWYRIAWGPWNDAYYVSADAFYNNGRTSGSLSGTPFVDLAVGDC